MRQRPIPVLILLIALALVAAFWWNSRSAADSVANASAAAGGNRAGGAPANAAGAAGTGASAIRAIDPNAPGALPGQLQAAAATAGETRPRAGRFDQLAELQSRNSLAASIREAAGTDDPAANAFVMEMIDFCLRNTSPKTKTQATAASYVPARLRATTAKDPLDPIHDAAERTRMLESNRAMVEICSEFNVATAKTDANVALQKLTARGAQFPAVLAMVTSSADLGSLTAEQFEVISKTLSERDVGTLAVLGQLLQPLLSNLMANNAPSTVTEPRYYADVNAPLAWQLALCQLGAYCGHDSLWAREACFYYGACAGDDLATAVRSALTRDGLNPALLDKQAEQYVRAITNGDPGALGVRRKKP